MNDKKFEMPKAEVIIFDAEDVITTSVDGGFLGPADPFYDPFAIP